MVSTGMRIGGLRELQIGDIKKIDEHGLYLIWVYNRSGKDRYYIFCSQECVMDGNSSQRKEKNWFV